MPAPLKTYLNIILLEKSLIKQEWETGRFSNKNNYKLNKKKPLESDTIQ